MNATCSGNIVPVIPLQVVPPVPEQSVPVRYSGHFVPLQKTLQDEDVF